MIYKVKQEHRFADTHKVICSLVEAFATECRKLGYWVENVKLSYNRAEVTFKQPSFNTNAVERFWDGFDDDDDCALPEEAVCTAPDKPAHGGLRQTVMKDIMCNPANGAESAVAAEAESEPWAEVPAVSDGEEVGA